MGTLSITEELGGLETVFSDVVYPVWPLWLAAGVIGMAVATVVAYRLGWHRIALHHRLLTSVSVAAILAISIPAGWYAIPPLFERNTVCEASPLPGAGAGSDKCSDVALAATMPPTAKSTVAATSAATIAETLASTAVPTAATPVATATTTAAPTAAPFEPRVLQRGAFVGADDFHFANGKVLVIETAPGAYTLRLEEFSVRNGPDVFVLLSSTNGYESTALNLGGLKGTDGAFNYDIPAGTDLSVYKSAIIWCKQFDVLFGHAAFSPA